MLNTLIDSIRRFVPRMVVLAGFCAGFQGTIAHGAITPAAEKIDLSIAPLFDGRQNELVNTWGGTWQTGSMRKLSIEQVRIDDKGTQGVPGPIFADSRPTNDYETRPAKIGTVPERLALAAETGPLAAGHQTYLQCLACGFGPTRAYFQTRDLARYSALRFTMSNDTGAALDAALQLKDYRDSLRHRAIYHYALPAKSGWRQIDVPLSLTAANWTVEGEPDLSRVLTIDFIFTPQKEIFAGRICLESVALVERGGPLDIDSSPLRSLVDRMARRQWDALWSARSRDSGLIPNNSYQSTDAGLNCTAAVLWMLPAATRRHWISQDEADRYVQTLLGTIDRLLDKSHYLPPRNVDWVTLKPSLLPEESTVDAAFLALALHQYKTLARTPPALRQAMDRTENRFNFSAFARPNGWRMSYRCGGQYGSGGFVPFIYDGYTNEGNVISLAAHLAVQHHVPIETLWSADVMRVRTPVLKRDVAPVVHSFSEFRAPFTQALLNLFVDVRGRGIDRYPDAHLAVNPWENYVCYEQQVMARLAELQRPYMVQPDAGDDGTLRNYQQFSLYNDFGQRDLFMPWSAAFALQTQAAGGAEALRFLLRHGLHDPLGMADSAKWATGAAEPYAVAARHDFWNTSLGTMALLEWLDGEEAASHSFAALPEVRDGLDHVFRTPVGRLHDAEVKPAAMQVVVKMPILTKTAAETKPVKAQVVDVTKRN